MLGPPAAAPGFFGCSPRQFDEQPVRPEIDTRHRRLNERPGIDVGICVEVLPHGRYNDVIDLSGRDPADAASLLRLTLVEHAGDVIAVLLRSFTRKGWRHPLAMVIKQASRKQGRR